jgi:thiol-disulfide isomerase/thioredoxin
MDKYLYVSLFIISMFIIYKVACMCLGKTEKFSEDAKKVYFIYADWCGHCTRFKPEWQKFEKACSGNGIEAKSLNVDDTTNTKFIESNDVSSFPTVLVTKGNGEKIKYEGERTSDDLIKFVNAF